MTLPRGSKYLEILHIQFNLLSYLNQESEQNRSMLNYYVKSNVKIMFTNLQFLESRKTLLLQNAGKIEHRGARNNKRKKKKKKMLRQNLSPTKVGLYFPRTLTLSRRIEYFRYDPSLFKNTSALFPAPSQISKSREEGGGGSTTCTTAVTPHLTGALLNRPILSAVACNDRNHLEPRRIVKKSFLREFLLRIEEYVWTLY